MTCQKHVQPPSNEKPDVPPGRFVPCIPMSPAQFGFVSSIYTVGGLFGAMVSGSFSTKFGRLNALRLSACFFLLGPVAEAVANHMFLLVLGRFLAGIGAGFSIVVGPIYVAELAPKSLRGMFGASTQIMTNVGIVVAQALGYQARLSNEWRHILATGFVFAVVQMLGLAAVPESPVWLTDRGRVDIALPILHSIRGAGAPVEEEIATWREPTRIPEQGNLEEGEALIQRISAAVTPQEKAEVSMLDTIRDPIYRPAVIAAVGILAGQQFTGINSIIMYSVSILSSIFPSNSELLSVYISLINLFATIIFSPLSDRLGRKVCILVSLSGMFLSSVMLASGMNFGVNFFAAAGCLLFVGAFAIGLGPIPFILASELVGPEAVGAVQSWSLSANLLATFVIAQFFPLVNEAMGGQGRVYILFALFDVVFALFISSYVPETKGKTSMVQVWGWGARRDD